MMQQQAATVEAGAVATAPEEAMTANTANTYLDKNTAEYEIKHEIKHEVKKEVMQCANKNI